MTQPVVEFQNVFCRYGATTVLENINLHLHKGQFAGVLGPSGAGKTTLLKAVLGLIAPASGLIRVGGETLRGKPSQRVAYVPQVETVDWNFPLTVEQAVLMGRTTQTSLWPWPTKAEQQLAYSVMERLGIVQFSKRHIRELSGGQQQRIFLARALIAEPQMLVLDEPTAGVDMRTQEDILHLLVDLNRDGVTILMTTHDLNAAAAHLPWVICLNRGVIAQGTPEEVFIPETLNATYHGDMVVVRQDGMIFVQERPHRHTYHDVIPNPVLSHHNQDGHDKHNHIQDDSNLSEPAETIEPELAKRSGIAEMDVLLAPFKYEFFRNGVMASMLIGVLCGLLGVYIVLRGMSYIGHGLSHAIFGGAAVAFVMKWNFYIGAGTWGFLAAILINQTVRRFRINADAAIGIITTASFAVGVAVISRQRSFTRDLEASLFGSILGVDHAQLIGVAVTTLVIAIGVFLLYKPLLFTTFDEETARAYGVRTQWLDVFFSLALASAIIVSMQVIGVTLIAAAIVIPPITARLLTDRFDVMLVLSAVFGALTALAGIYLSYYLDTSSGATIVITQTVIFLLVLVVNGIRGRNRLAAIDYRI